MRYGYKKWCAIDKFPAQNFESAAKKPKFENLPVAHWHCGALRVYFFAILPGHTPPPPVDRLSSLLKN
jgi:hypothetical protein